MRYLRIARFVGTTGLVSLALACGGAPTEPTKGMGGGSISATDPVHETVVHLNADGTQTTKQVIVSHAQFEAQLALRRAAASAAKAPQGGGVHTSAGEATATTSEAISVDDGCSNPDDLWLSDNESGCSGNIVCLSGLGGLNLGAIPYPDPTDTSMGPNSWVNHVAGYSPGTESGMLIDADLSVANSWDSSDSFYCFAAGGNGWPKWVSLIN